MPFTAWSKSLTPEKESSPGSNDTLAERLKNSVQAPTGSFLLLLMESFQSRLQPDLMFKLADYDLLSPSQTCHQATPAGSAMRCFGKMRWMEAAGAEQALNQEQKQSSFKSLLHCAAKAWEERREGVMV